MSAMDNLHCRLSHATFHQKTPQRCTPFSWNCTVDLLITPGHLQCCVSGGLKKFFSSAGLPAFYCFSPAYLTKRYNYNRVPLIMFFHPPMKHNICAETGHDEITFKKLELCRVGFQSPLAQGDHCHNRELRLV